MPEMEARPPTENRHGGAPRGERLGRHGPSRAERRDNGNTAPFGAPLAPHGADGKETSKTRAQQRAAGTKKTVLFDIVNRKVAVGVLPTAPNRVSGNALVSRPSARLGAPFFVRCWFAREHCDRPNLSSALTLRRRRSRRLEGEGGQRCPHASRRRAARGSSA